MKIFKTICLLILLAISQSAGQNSTDLSQIKQEIDALKQQYRSSESRERSIREKIEDLNHDIGMRRRLIRKLENEKTVNLQNIKKIETSLQSTIKQYDQRRDLISKRFVSMYKKGRQSDWEAALSLNTVNQFLIWMKYQQVIIKNDKRNIRLLKKQEEEIREQRDQLRNEQTKKEWLIREASSEQNSLEKDKTEEKALLSSVELDKKSLQEQIKQKQRAYQRIEKLIASGEKNRKRTSYKQINADFDKLKTKMNWPANGTVVSKYGNFQNKDYKIDEKNIGIDIEASDGDMVKAVCKGRIFEIDWQRGLGNIVVVDHGKGYYSVYGRLNVVFVNIGEDIEMGTILGQVGSQGSLHGSMLHFQIWKGENSLNPAVWLRNKR